MDHASDYKGFDASDALYLYSAESGTIYDTVDGSGKYFTCGPRLNQGTPRERGSRMYVARMLRTPPLDAAGKRTGCTDLAQLSDRIQVSARVDREGAGEGYLDIEIRARHGVSATPLFRAQFNIAQRQGLNDPEWLVTLSGFVATEWEVHASFVPIAGGGDPIPMNLTASVMLSVSVDRAGNGGPENGLFRATWNEPLVTNNTFAPILPILSLDFATFGSIANPAYPVGSPTWAFGFIPDGVAISLIGTTTDPLIISFDGVTDHITMIPGTPTASVTIPTSRWQLFARSPTGNPVAYQILATRRGGV